MPCFLVTITPREGVSDASHHVRAVAADVVAHDYRTTFPNAEVNVTACAEHLTESKPFSHFRQPLHEEDKTWWFWYGNEIIGVAMAPNEGAAREKVIRQYDLGILPDGMNPTEAKSYLSRSTAKVYIDDPNHPVNQPVRGTFIPRMMHEEVRSLATIAAEIRREWPKVNYAAKPYLDAMAELNSINDMYMYDTARSVVLYFLANAASFKGDAAKRLKAELKALLK
jgi:hypothetical protein